MHAQALILPCNVPQPDFLGRAGGHKIAAPVRRCQIADATAGRRVHPLLYKASLCRDNTSQ